MTEHPTLMLDQKNIRQLEAPQPKAPLNGAI